MRCASPRGLHRIAYREWGDPKNRRVLVCVHGLTRSARDFDALAAALSEHYRVVCPDVAGRGDSEWLPDPMLYQLPQYLGDMVTLVARLDVEGVDWLGTSMGGLRMHYDPKLAEPFRAQMPEKDLELWPLWDAIRSPTLVLRGALSDLLTKETSAQMTQRGPKAVVVEIPGVGHAPTLMHEGQIRVVRDFLLR